MNNIVVTEFLDESSKIHDRASGCGCAILFEICSKFDVIKDLIADVGLLSDALHLIFKVSCDTEIN